MLNTAEKTLIVSSVVLVFFLMYSVVEVAIVTYHHTFMVNESDLLLGKMPGYILLFLTEALSVGLLFHFVAEFGKKHKFLKLKLILYKYLRSSMPLSDDD